jgi:hypothetical protein
MGPLLLRRLMALCAAASVAATPTEVRRVYVVFSSHLDIGYTGGTATKDAKLAVDVINDNFDQLFPRAVATAAALRAKNMTYGWMTHSWLASIYVNCTQLGLSYRRKVAAALPGNRTIEDVHCPNEDQLAVFRAAVRRGDIGWHAYPHNAQAEMMEPSLYAFGVEMTQTLDKALGRTPSSVVSLRDVPGMTRAVVPLLHQAGVKAITVGVNAACSPAAVNKSFVWRDPESGTEILAMQHANGYGGIELEDCVIAGDAALAFAWRADNTGPHTPGEVLDIYARLSNTFPAAAVFSSTFDDFVAKELATGPNRAKLPVVTGEIGDTWLWACQSDPRKVAEFRLLSRLRAKCLLDGKCSNSDPRVFAFSRWLIKIPEHVRCV